MRLSAPPLVRRSYLIIKYKQLWALDMDRAMYALIRTKQKFCVGSNKAGCLLAHPLRAQTTQRRVKALMGQRGQCIDHNDQIVQAFAYDQLYTAVPLVEENYTSNLEHIPLEKLPTIDGWQLDQDVKLDEAMYPRAMDRKHWGALLCTGVLDLDFKKQKGVSR
ncbi:hypothetical protein NDU88_001812 [Pleurodeles waltl]|uniref:Uncharacterized protein n=1 Tax=Pleurodeles waltl TaxID=8319 RepID=A0AAV7M263_PLEWA|nr:hypothetical protein NDU88_001812 [Pleurodeles waltl]